MHLFRTVDSGQTGFFFLKTVQDSAEAFWPDQSISEMNVQSISNDHSFISLQPTRIRAQSNLSHAPTAWLWPPSTSKQWHAVRVWQVWPMGFKCLQDHNRGNLCKCPFKLNWKSCASAFHSIVKRGMIRKQILVASISGRLERDGGNRLGVKGTLNPFLPQTLCNLWLMHPASGGLTDEPALHQSETEQTFELSRLADYAQCISV